MNEFIREVLAVVCAGLILYALKWVFVYIKDVCKRASKYFTEPDEDFIDDFEDYELYDEDYIDEDYIDDIDESEEMPEELSEPDNRSAELSEDDEQEGSGIGQMIVYLAMFFALFLFGIDNFGILPWLKVDSDVTALIKFSFYALLSVYFFVEFILSIIGLIRKGRISEFAENCMFFLAVSFITLLSYFEAENMLESLFPMLF